MINLFYKTFDIADGERGILSDRGHFKEILKPGRYRRVRFGHRYNLACYEISDRYVYHPHIVHIAKDHPKTAQRFFDAVATNDQQIALIYEDGILVDHIGPGEKQWYWQGLVERSITYINLVESWEVPKAVLQVHRQNGVSLPLTLFSVPDGYVGLVYRDGALTGKHQPGIYGFWHAAGHIETKLVDLRTRTIDVTGQEILTKDKVALRVNVAANYKVVDVAKAIEGARDYYEQLYKTLQFALRQALGTKTLEQILDDKIAVDAQVSEMLSATTEPLGLKVWDIGLKDVILPGEMRTILNEVVTAEKQAQANLIRRREETAATRSLLNTAKLMESNPTLMRLKELEALEKVADKVDGITVHGGFNGLLNELVSLKAS